MPKPSIFSKDYDREMRKRRNRKRFTLLILILFVIIVIIKGILKFGNKDLSQSKPNKDVKKENVIKKDNKEVEKNKLKDEKQKEKNKLEDKSYLIKLSNGEEVKLSYNEIDGKKQYTKVEPEKITYTISPSKTKVVIMEDKTQNMILVDINGTQNDITKKEYVSSRGKVFTKDSILNSKPNYIWCNSPKFLDEDNIVYISQLPWFNKENIKYLWKYTISTNNYNNNILGREISGNNIEYGNLGAEGLEIIVDGVKNIVK